MKWLFQFEQTEQHNHNGECVHQKTKGGRNPNTEKQHPFQSQYSLSYGRFVGSFSKTGQVSEKVTKCPEACTETQLTSPQVRAVAIGFSGKFFSEKSLFKTTSSKQISCTLPSAVCSTSVKDAFNQIAPLLTVKIDVAVKSRERKR